MKLKRFFVALVVLSLILCSLVSCAKNSDDPVYVEMKVRGYGTIVLCLDPTVAPQTVDHFVKLVKSGFYDGITFHRIIPGFMIQGGMPGAASGSVSTIPGEFKSNGYDNPLSHKRGVISMARTSEPNSASSQFFICNADATELDGDYAAFGWVVEGMEVVDLITSTTYPYTNPYYNYIILDEAYRAVIEYARVIDYTP